MRVIACNVELWFWYNNSCEGRLEADVELESIVPPFRKFLDTELSIEVIDVWLTSVGQLCVCVRVIACNVELWFWYNNSCEVGL